MLIKAFLLLLEHTRVKRTRLEGLIYFILSRLLCTLVD